MHSYSTIKKIVSFVFISLLALNTYSQCTETATDFGNNFQDSRYNVNGDVSVTVNANNTITLDLASNFSTASGPDVRAYLVNSNGLSNTQLASTRIANLENFQLGLVSCNACSPEIIPVGEKSFTVNIPSNVNINDFDTVLFYCLDFNVFWDFGKFSPFESTSCDVLSVEDNILDKVSIYPNPATTNIQLANIDFINSEIRIFDVSGKKVFQQLKGNVNEIIDVSNLKSGLYVLSIIENNRQFSKELVIQ